MKKKILFAVTLIIFISICIFFSKELQFSKEGLTLLEAYQNGYRVAFTLNKDVMLYTMTSADVEGQKEYYEGIKGIRNNWNIDFAVPDSSTHYIIQIKNGRVIKTSKTVGLKKTKNELIDSQELLIDSPKVLKLAKKSYSIKKGVVWAIGYHYTIHKMDNKTIIIITASDMENRLTQIGIEATRGNIISAKHKLQLGGGLYFDDSLINEMADFEVMGITQTRDFSMVALWGVKLINTIEYNPTIMYQYNGGGWNQLQAKDDIKNIIFLDEIRDKMLVIYNQKVEMFDLQTKIWTSLVTYDQILASGSNGKTACLITDKNIISIDSKLKEDYLLNFTNDCLQKIEDMVDVGVDGTIYFGSTSKMYFFNGEELNNIDLEGNLLDIKVKDNFLYILTEKQIYTYDINTGSIIFSSDNKNSLITFIDNQSNDKILCLDSNSYLLQVEIEECGWKITQLNTPDKDVIGNLTDILIDKEGKWFYATQSISKWIELSKKE